jgi:predicted phage-related endonuclease
MLNQEQMAAHYAGIGGSAVGKVLGVDPYDSPLDYYSKLVRFMDESKLPEEDEAFLKDNEAALWGNLLENAIATEWARRNSVKVMKTSKPRWDKELPFLVANPDRLVVGQKRGLEVKNRTAYKLRDYEAGPLETELLQCAHYMGVFGATQWDLAVLVGGQKLLTFGIKRDDELISLCRDACSRFWNEHVLPRNPPPPTRLADLEAYYRRGRKGLAVTATPQILEALDALRDAKARAKAVEEEVENFEFTIKATLLEATELNSPEGSTLATWRNNKDSEAVDYKGLAETLLKRIEDAEERDALLKVHSFTKPGARVFRLSPVKTPKSEESVNVAA